MDRAAAADRRARRRPGHLPQPDRDAVAGPDQARRERRRRPADRPADVGSAAGIAITGSVFFGTLAGSSGDYAASFRDAVLVIAAFVAAALALAVADIVTSDA